MAKTNIDGKEDPNLEYLKKFLLRKKQYEDDISRYLQNIESFKHAVLDFKSFNYENFREKYLNSFFEDVFNLINSSPKAKELREYIENERKDEMVPTFENLLKHYQLFMNYYLGEEQKLEKQLESTETLSEADNLSFLPFILESDKKFDLRREKVKEIESIKDQEDHIIFFRKNLISYIGSFPENLNLMDYLDQKMTLGEVNSISTLDKLLTAYDHCRDFYQILHSNSQKMMNDFILKNADFISRNRDKIFFTDDKKREFQYCFETGNLKGLLELQKKFPFEYKNELKLQANFEENLRENFKVNFLNALNTYMSTFFVDENIGTDVVEEFLGNKKDQIVMGQIDFFDLFKESLRGYQNFENQDILINNMLDAFHRLTLFSDITTQVSTTNLADKAGKEDLAEETSLKPSENLLEHQQKLEDNNIKYSKFIENIQERIDHFQSRIEWAKNFGDSESLLAQSCKKFISILEKTETLLEETITSEEKPKGIIEYINEKMQPKTISLTLNLGEITEALKIYKDYCENFLKQNPDLNETVQQIEKNVKFLKNSDISRLTSILLEDINNFPENHILLAYINNKIKPRTINSISNLEELVGHYEILQDYCRSKCENIHKEPGEFIFSDPKEPEEPVFLVQSRSEFRELLDKGNLRDLLNLCRKSPVICGEEIKLQQNFDKNLREKFESAFLNALERNDLENFTENFIGEEIIARFPKYKLRNGEVDFKSFATDIGKLDNKDGIKSKIIDIFYKLMSYFGIENKMRNSSKERFYSNMVETVENISPILKTTSNKNKEQNSEQAR